MAPKRLRAPPAASERCAAAHAGAAGAHKAPGVALQESRSTPGGLGGPAMRSAQRPKRRAAGAPQGRLPSAEAPCNGRTAGARAPVGDAPLWQCKIVREMGSCALSGAMLYWSQPRERMNRSRRWLQNSSAVKCARRCILDCKSIDSRATMSPSHHPRTGAAHPLARRLMRNWAAEALASSAGCTPCQRPQVRSSAVGPLHSR